MLPSNQKANEASSEAGFAFFKAGENEFGPRPQEDEREEWARRSDVVRKHITDVMGARNVAFLFGSGCSSRVIDDFEVGIPTMVPMAKSVLGEMGVSTLDPERNDLSKSIGLDLTQDDLASNLERVLEVLFSLRFALSRSDMTELKKAAQSADRLISKIVKQIVAHCAAGGFVTNDTVLATYEAFYRKLVYRDRALPRPWIFTTNYDLFNERAMDRLAIPYCNGFSGSVERRFNPALFRYSLAEQIDVASRKWTAVDSFVYLCKLHGSINWVEDRQGLFPIRELQGPSSEEGDQVMIFPTPAKQNASFGSPYSDLLREFQSRVIRDQSVLVTIGYGFGDEHLNNLIFRALTVPTFRLVSFVSPDSPGVVSQLRDLRDPRIWLIGGSGADGRKAHHFNVFVDEFMPETPRDDAEKAVESVLRELMTRPKSSSDLDDPDDLG